MGSWRLKLKNIVHWPLAVSGILLIIFYTYCEINSLKHSVRVGDFFHFYEAAKAITLGNHIFSSGHGGYIYPPLVAFLMTPLTHFPLKTSAFIWFIINILLLTTTLIIGFRTLTKILPLQFKVWQAAAVCSLTFLLAYHEIWWELNLGQTDLLVLAFMALSLQYMDRKPFLAGIFLGLSAIIKYQTILFLPFLICRGRWRTVFGMVFGILTGALLPAIMIGWQQNLNDLLIALRGIIHMRGEYAARVPEIVWGGNVSITSGLARIFSDHHLSIHLSFLISGIIAIGGLLLIAWIFRRQGLSFFFRASPTNIFFLEFAALMAFILIFSPQCNIRHLILLIPLHLFSATMLLSPRPGIKFGLIGVLIFPAGKLTDDLIIHPLGWQWSYFGGDCWCLLFALPLIINAGLTYIKSLEVGHSICILRGIESNP